MTFGSGAAGDNVGRGVTGAELYDPDGGAGVGGCHGVTPRVGAMSGPHGIDLG